MMKLKRQLTERNPYANWLKENRIDLSDIEVKQRVPTSLGEEYDNYLKVFGYTKEDFEFLIKPMAIEGQEPVSSMGNDTPLAVMSDKPQRLFNYFRQHFAQVTNPPIDPIREGLVMSLTNYIGSVSRNLLMESPSHCKLIKFRSPIVTNTDLGKIKNLDQEQFSHVVIPMLFAADSDNPGKALEKAIAEMCRKAEEAVDKGHNFIILSDRGISRNHGSHSFTAGCICYSSSPDQYTRRECRLGLIVETAEPREVNHFALLFAYGASVVNPYGAFAIIEKLCETGEIKDDYVTAREHFIKSIDKGLAQGHVENGNFHPAKLSWCTDI